MNGTISAMEVDDNDEETSGMGISVERKAEILTKAEELLEIANEYTAGNYTRLVESFIESDVNVSVVKNPGDALFTLNILEMTSESAVKKHEKLQQGSVTEELFDFLAADGITMGSWCPGEMERLKKLCSFVPHPFNFQAILTSTNGLPEVVPTQKKPRVIRKLAQKEAVKLKEMNNTQTDNSKHEENMKTALEVLLKLCKGGNWYPYFKLVINPKSFTQTTYNIFIVSFLINERYAKMCVKDTEPFIAPIKKNINDIQRRKDSILKRKRTDTILSINSHEWEKLVQVLEITKSQLPNMQPAVEEGFDQSEVMSLEIAQGIEFVH